MAHRLQERKRIAREDYVLRRAGRFVLEIKKTIPYNVY